ncbi:MAG: SRPBCC family protein [Ferrimicrobium sp.]
MEITNEFSVAVSIERAWEVLTDLDTVASCLPGAKLTGREGDDYLGSVRVKVGPITASYSGKAHFSSMDVEKHVAVLRAEGREIKGQGNASATVTATLVPLDDGTKVTVEVDLTIAGRVAQFGRGVLVEVSEKLMGQFADALEKKVLAPVEETTASDASESDVLSSGSSEPGGTVASREEFSSHEINAIRVAAKPIAKRVAPIFAVLVVIGILLRRRGSRH